MVNIIFIRKEYIVNELRVCLVPQDIPKLTGFTVYIESCKKRIYTDEQYQSQGAIVTTLPWYHSDFKNALILGLKELDHLEHLNEHNHVYFSHSYKNQEGSKIILDAFHKSKSTIYDFEYFKKQSKRVISFGYYAGIVGGVLGLAQYHSNLPKLNPETFKELLNKKWNTELKIAIIGAYGKVGLGVCKILGEMGINNYDIFDRSTPKNKLSNYDIVFNCILLDYNNTEVWFSRYNIFKKKLVICDISCDNTKPNNPINLYNHNTTWEDPVFHYNEFVDIISISNLPSLMPKESSDYFSKQCVELLLERDSMVWENCKKIFNLFQPNLLIKMNSI